jgi:hypothetical protein
MFPSALTIYISLLSYMVVGGDVAEISFKILGK